MPRVRIIADPFDLASYSEHQCDAVVPLLQEKMGSWPPTARLYKNQVAVECDVTPDTQDKLDALEACSDDDIFYAVVYPGDPITALITVVATLALTAAVLLFLTPKIPTLDNNNQSANNSLGNRVNKPRPNERIPDIYGSVVSVPELLAVPLLVFENNIEKEVCFMCVGRGAHEITDVKDGDTPIVNIAGAGVAFYGPGTSPNYGVPFLSIGSPVNEPVLDVQRSNEVNGQVLRTPMSGTLNGANNIRFTYPDTIERSGTDFAFSDYFSPDSKITVSNADVYNGTYTALSVSEDRIVVSAPNPPWPNGSSAYVSPSITTTETPSVGEFTVDHDGCDELVFNFTAPQGMYRLNEQGKNRDRSVTITVSIKVTDASGNPTGAVYGGSVTISGNGNDRRPKGSTLRVAVAGRYFKVSAKRDTGPYQDTDETTVDEVRWRDLFSTRMVPDADFGNLTTVQTLTYATAGATSVKERKINCRATRKVNRLLKATKDISINFVGGTMPNGASFSRASSANYFDNNGVLQAVGPNAPRLVPGGIILEQASTNYVTRSRYLPNTNWIGTTGTSRAAAAGLDNVQNACLVTITATTNQQLEVPISTALPPGTYTLSLFYKTTDMADIGSVGYYNNGAAVFAIPLAPRKLTLSGSWVRLTYTFDVTTTDNITAPRFRIRGFSGSNVGQSVTLDYAQIEPGASATTPILTTGTAGVRAADQLTINWGQLGVPDGPRTIRYTFADNTTQDVNSVVTNGIVVVPVLAKTTLASAKALAVPDIGPEYAIPYTFSNQLVGSRHAGDILCSMALDPFIGGRTIAELDIGQIYDTIAEVQDYFGFPEAGQFGYTFDQDNLSFEEMAQSVAQAVFCTAYRQAAVLRLYFERATDANDAVLLFNHRNKVPGSETRTVRFGNLNDHDGVELDYVSGDDGAKLTIYIPEDQSATKAKKIDLQGVIDYRGDAAVPFIHASRAYAKIKYQHTATQFTATGEATQLVLTQRVEITDNTRPDVYDGEVRGQDGLVLDLSQPFEPDPAGDYTIFLQHPDGGLASIACTPGPGTYQCTLQSPPDFALVLDTDAWALTTYQITSNGTGRPSAFLLSEKGTYDGGTVDVQAINYDDRYYAADQTYKGA